MFTGRIGTDNSQLVDIVLGIVDLFELSTIGFSVHALTSKEIRVLFDRSVTDSALLINSYSVSKVDLDAYVPDIESVSFYDSNHTSVIIKFIDRLTWTKIYSIKVSGVTDFNNQGVTGASSNFTANVQDPPRAVSAYMGRRGTIDIVFDRSVGEYSTSAIAQIQGVNHIVPAVGMTLLDWSTENLLDNVVRFVIPISTPTDDGFEILFDNIKDISGNTSSGSIIFTHKLRSLTPYNESSINQIQFIDSYALGISSNTNICTIRVYFNVPVNNISVTNQSNWIIDQFGPHIVPDTVNNIFAIDAFDLFTVISLLNNAKLVFNRHITQDVSHITQDQTSVITTPDAYDYDSSVSLLNSLCNNYGRHTLSNGIHLYLEVVLQPSNNVIDLTSLILASNNFKTVYNNHISESRTVSFNMSLPTTIGSITNHASTINFTNLASPFHYFVDLHVNSHTIVPNFRVRGTILSEDGGSSTSTLDFSGDIISRSVSSDASIQYHEVIVDKGVNLYFDRELSFANNSFVKVKLSQYDLLPWNVGNDVYAQNIEYSLSTTLNDLVSTINDLLYSYSYHISVNGAEHLSLESVYIINNSDYPSSTSIEDLIISVNKFKNIYNGHVQNSIHTNHDKVLYDSDATDFNSLVLLVDKLRKLFMDHNDSGFENNGLIKPRLLGCHIKPGPHTMTSNLWTVLKILFDNIKDFSDHNVIGSVQDVIFDPINMKYISKKIDINELFSGISYIPCFSSVIPISGLCITENFLGLMDSSLQADSIELYFSKSMNMTPLTSGNVTITGGSVTTSNLSWKNDKVINITVSNMEKIQYTIAVTGLTDLAGNPIY